MLELLKSIIGDRDVNELKCSEANQIVNEFYLQVMLANLGNRDQKRIDYLVNKTLARFGLEYFA